MGGEGNPLRTEGYRCIPVDIASILDFVSDLSDEHLCQPRHPRRGQHWAGGCSAPSARSTFGCLPVDATPLPFPLHSVQRVHGRAQHGGYSTGTPPRLASRAHVSLPASGTTSSPEALLLLLPPFAHLPRTKGGPSLDRTVLHSPNPATTRAESTATPTPAVVGRNATTTKSRSTPFASTQPLLAGLSGRRGHAERRIRRGCLCVGGRTVRCTVVVCQHSAAPPPPPLANSRRGNTAPIWRLCAALPTRAGWKTWDQKSDCRIHSYTSRKPAYMPAHTMPAGAWTMQCTLPTKLPVQHPHNLARRPFARVSHQSPVTTSTCLSCDCPLPCLSLSQGCVHITRCGR